MLRGNRVLRQDGGKTCRRELEPGCSFHGTVRPERPPSSAVALGRGLPGELPTTYFS
jgi:hypothetical protein